MKGRDDTTKDQGFNPSPPLQQKVNHNGFTNSPPLSQVLPPILVILTLLMTMIAINVQMSSIAGLVICDLLLLADSGIMVWLWYKTTSIVPTDSVQLRHLEAIQKGEEFDHSKLAFFCHTCKTYTNSNCFHCKRCRRCVQFFDHHCKWLNNCIGAKNYFEFYGLIIVTFILLALCISMTSYCLSQMDVDHQSQSANPVVLVFSILTILTGAVPCVWLMYLIGLHTYLIITKKSTIQLIMESRNKNQIKPKDDKRNQVFRVHFTKNSADDSVNIKKVNFPERQEELENSNTETNHNLVRNQTLFKEALDLSLSTYKGRTLPPLKTKINLNFAGQQRDIKILNTLTPPPIERS